MAKAKRYAAEYRGKKFPLTLRVAGDGFVTGYEYAAATALVAPFLSKRYTLHEQIWMDESTIGTLLNLITEQGARGGWISKDEDGRQIVTPLPWQSWFELDAALLQQIVTDFFFYLTPKIEQSENLPNFMQVPIKTSFSIVSAMLLIQRTGDSSEQAEVLTKLTALSGGAAGTTSNDS